MWLLCLALVLLAGCGPNAVGGVDTIIHLQSLVGVVGGEAKVASGCIWVLGGTGATRAFALVSTHGNATVRDCMELHLFRLDGLPAPMPPGP